MSKKAKPKKSSSAPRAVSPRLSAREANNAAVLRGIVEFEASMTMDERLAAKEFDGCTYCPVLAAAVLRAVSDGLTLRNACTAIGGRIKGGHFNAWLRADAELNKRYGAALRQQAEAFADEIVHIADEALLLPEAIAKARLQVGVRQWLMERNNGRFGEKKTVVHEGNPDKPMQQNITNAMTPAQAAEEWGKMLHKDEPT